MTRNEEERATTSRPATPVSGDGDLVGHATGEEILRGIAGSVLERQHCNDRTRRLRRSGSDSGAEEDRGETGRSQTEAQGMKFHSCRTPDGGTDT